MALRAVVPAAPAAAPRSIHPSVLIPRLPLPNVPIGVFLAMAAPLPPGPRGTLRDRLAETPGRGNGSGTKVGFVSGRPPENSPWGEGRHGNRIRLAGSDGEPRRRRPPGVPRGVLADGSGTGRHHAERRARPGRAG